MRMPRTAESVNLTGLAIEGKVLLPLHKTRKQIEMAKVAARDRNNLLEAAKKGDEDAMETLTIEDIDLYSQVSRSAMKEDLYSIVDSSFMPCGIECDQYSIIGEITGIETKENRVSGELVYDLTISCSDMVFHVGIAQKDLDGRAKSRPPVQGANLDAGNRKICRGVSLAILMDFCYSIKVRLAYDVLIVKWI